MDRGLDTTFLVQAEVLEHPDHTAAKTIMDDLLDAGETFVLAPQVLSEFIHIVTDSRRFSRPLSMEQAIARGQLWWDAREVVHAFPGDESTRLYFSWLKEYRLGRKRLLDTYLAATYYCHGVRSILSSNVRDYGVFGCFEVISP